jgi:hypothetical protein
MAIYDAVYAADGWTRALDVVPSITRSCGALIYAAPTSEAVKFSASWGGASARRWDEALRDYARRFRRPGVTGYDDVGIAAQPVIAAVRGVREGGAGPVGG